MSGGRDGRQLTQQQERKREILASLAVSSFSHGLEDQQVHQVRDEEIAYSSPSHPLTSSLTLLLLLIPFFFVSHSLRTSSHTHNLFPATHPETLLPTPDPGTGTLPSVLPICNNSFQGNRGRDLWPNFHLLLPVFAERQSVPLALPLSPTFARRLHAEQEHYTAYDFHLCSFCEKRLSS